MIEFQQELGRRMDRQQREHEEREFAERNSKKREQNERNSEIGYGDTQFLISQSAQLFLPEKYKYIK